MGMEWMVHISICLLLLTQLNGKQCPFRTSDLVLFNTIPQEGETLPGKCILNAEQEADDEYLTISCYKNGNYTTTGKCMCSPGYFLTNRKECVECEEGYSKADIGNNDRCLFQGDNTIRCLSTTRLCPCKDKFFRVTEEKYIPGTHCYEAGRVNRINYSNYTDGSVIITWRSPFNKAGYQPVFLVSTNYGPVQRKTSTSLFFPKSNHTRQYNIKIITEVRVGEKVYQGDPFTSIITVHKTTESSGLHLKPNGRLASVLMFLSTLFFFDASYR